MKTQKFKGGFVVPLYIDVEIEAENYEEALQIMNSYKGGKLRGLYEEEKIEILNDETVGDYLTEEIYLKKASDSDGR